MVRTPTRKKAALDLKLLKSICKTTKIRAEVRAIRILAFRVWRLPFVDKKLYRNRYGALLYLTGQINSQIISLQEAMIIIEKSPAPEGPVIGATTHVRGW
jgi:hypothetical protein